MVRGDSVTISFRLNLNREEDTEIWNFLTGDALEACFGDKSECIKSAMIRMIHGIKQDEREKHLVVEMNTRMDVIQNAMTGEADRIINAVKLIVKEEVEQIAGIQSERDKPIPHGMTARMPERNDETVGCFEEDSEDLDETISVYAMSFMSDL